MLMLPRGETKNQRSHAGIAAWMGPNSNVSEPDERGVFQIDLEAADLEAAREHCWNAVGGSGTADHVALLEHPDLPEHWHARAKKPRGAPAAS